MPPCPLQSRKALVLRPGFAATLGSALLALAEDRSVVLPGTEPRLELLDCQVTHYSKRNAFSIGGWEPAWRRLCLSPLLLPSLQGGSLLGIRGAPGIRS